MNSNNSVLPIQWYESLLGEDMIRAGRANLQNLIPTKFYRVALQISQFPNFDYLDMVRSEVQFHVCTQLTNNSNTDVFAESEWLPFAARSIDFLILPHVLEFTYQPQNVFRELSECITPEGIVVIVGFNPHSMLGLMKYLNRYQSLTLQEANLLPILRVRDWLALLGFESLAGEIVFFQAPTMSRHPRRNRKFTETAGKRWWPGFGSVYVIVARKKEFIINLNKSGSFRRPFKKRGAVLQPAVERSVFYSDTDRNFKNGDLKFVDKARMHLH